MLPTSLSSRPTSHPTSHSLIPAVDPGFNCQNNSLDTLFNFFRGEAKEAYTQRLDSLLPLGIFYLTTYVIASIDLGCEKDLAAIEVNDKISNGLLTMEIEASYLMTTEAFPQKNLGQGRPAT